MNVELHWLGSVLLKGVLLLALILLTRPLWRRRKQERKTDSGK